MARSHRRIEQENWLRLRDWLSTPEWRPSEAAYLLYGLNPDRTEPAHGREEWHFDWLPNSRPSHLPDDPYSFARNVEITLERVQAIASAADFVRVRTPKQWIEWAVEAGIEPPWLSHALRLPALAKILDPSSCGIRPTHEAIKNPISQRGGKAKARHAHQTLQREHLEQDLKRWIADPPNGSTQVKYAQTLYDQLCEAQVARKGPWAPGVHPRPAPPVEVRTIEDWIRRMRTG